MGRSRLPLPRNLKDPAVSQTASEVQRTLTSLVAAPMAAGRFVTVAVTGGETTKVNHGLSGRVSGFFVTMTDAPVVLSRVPPPSTDDTKAFWIACNNDTAVDYPVNVTMWVF